MGSVSTSASVHAPYSLGEPLLLEEIPTSGSGLPGSSRAFTYYGFLHPFEASGKNAAILVPQGSEPYSPLVTQVSRLKADNS